LLHFTRTLKVTHASVEVFFLIDDRNVFEEHRLMANYLVVWVEVTTIVIFF